MTDPRKDPTLTDAEIETRRVDDGKPAWETPHLTEIRVTETGGGPGPITETDPTDDGGNS
jgi:hypothetical protein